MSKTVEVDAEALRQVLQALIGPDHLIRELQYTRDENIFPSNPITVLVNQYNAWAAKPKVPA